MKNPDLRFCLRKDPVSLDPGVGNDMVASQIHFMLLEGLMELNADMSLSPAQAKSYEISPDRKTYIFHLDETKWSDGSAVTAADFERSWKRILNPQFPSPDAYLLFCLKNGRAAKKGECDLDKVGIYSKNPKTLIVELEYPAPYFLQLVASSVYLPVHANEQFKPEHFISNGPFKLIGWKYNEELEFEKNLRYRQASKVKLNRIKIEIIDRELAALHMYASGHFDLIGAPLSFFPAILTHDLEQKELVATYPVATTKFLAFNTEVPPFTNANIRKAFSFAINRSGITHNITQFNEKEALHFVPPALLASHESILSPEAKPEKAQRFLQKGLQEIGKASEDLEKISFMYVASEINQLLALELQNQWSKILGVKVKLEAVDFKTLHERSQKGSYSIGLFALLADYGDPMNILERFQDRANHRNYSKWENKQYNALIEKAHHTTSKQEYLQTLTEAENILLDEMPIAGLFHENFLFLVHPHIKGFSISPLGHIYFDKISIE